MLTTKEKKIIAGGPNVTGAEHVCIVDEMLVLVAKQKKKHNKQKQQIHQIVLGDILRNFSTIADTPSEYW